MLCRQSCKCFGVENRMTVGYCLSFTIVIQIDCQEASNETVFSSKAGI